MSKRLPFSLLIALILPIFGLGACQATIHEGGTILKPEDVAKIEVGKATQGDVMALLGPPTLINSFRRERWIYVQDRQFKNLQRTFSRVANRIEITFSKSGIVRDIKRNFGEQLHNPVDLPEAENKQSFVNWLWDGKLVGPATDPAIRAPTGKATSPPESPVMTPTEAGAPMLKSPSVRAPIEEGAPALEWMPAHMEKAGEPDLRIKTGEIDKKIDSLVDQPKPATSETQELEGGALGPGDTAREPVGFPKDRPFP